MKKLSSSHSGFSIIELLVALGVFTVVASSIVMLAGLALRDADDVLKRLQARNFAREGMEVARAIRNDDWSLLEEGSHGLEIVNEKWQFSGTTSSPALNFKRKIEIVNVATDSKKVISEVEWRSGKKKKEVRLQNYLTNWQKTVSTSSPEGPQIAEARDVFVVGDYAYLALWNATYTLSIMDVSSPMNPVFAASLDLGAKARAIFVKNDYAYIGLNSGEVKIVDISDPENPSLVSTIPLGSDFQPSAIHVENGYTYIGIMEEDPGVIRCSGISTPDCNQTYSCASEVYDLGYQTITIFGMDIPLIWLAVGIGRGIDVDENYHVFEAIDLEDEGFRTYNAWSIVSDYVNLGELSSFFELDAIDVNGRGKDIEVYQDSAYIAVKNSNQGLARVNVDEVDDLEFIGGEDVGGVGYGVYVTEDYIFVATRNKNYGLEVVAR